MAQQLKQRLWSELNKEEDEIDWSYVLHILRQNENAVRWYRESTVLHRACQRGASFAVIQEIHDLWPDGNKLDDYDWYPVHFACRHHQSLSVIELLTQGENAHATLNARNGNGELPLHCACRNQSVEVIQLLIDRGGHETVQVRNRYGRLPLHLACIGEMQTYLPEGHSLDVVKLLVKHFPEATRIQDNEGRLPSDWARESSRPRAVNIVQWLEDREAKLARANLIFSQVRDLDNAAVEELKQLFTRLKSCSTKKRRIDQA